MDDGEQAALDALARGIVYSRTIDAHEGPLPIGNLNAVAGRRYRVEVIDLGLSR